MARLGGESRDHLGREIGLDLTGSIPHLGEHFRERDPGPAFHRMVDEQDGGWPAVGVREQPVDASVVERFLEHVAE